MGIYFSYIFFFQPKSLKDFSFSSFYDKQETKYRAIIAKSTICEQCGGAQL